MDYILTGLVVGLLTLILGMIKVILTLDDNSKSFKQNADVNEMNMLNNMSNSIIDTMQNFYLNFNSKSKKEQEKWDSILFNKLEFLCFLINNNKIKDKKSILYFKDTILDCYDDIFIKYHKKDLKNETIYPEFKQLYQKFKKRK